MIDQTTTTHTTSDTPLITINQINLSAKQIWAIIAGTFTLLAALVAQGFLYVPAKADDLDSLSAIVMTVQQQHAETRSQMAAMTVQTAKLSEAVESLRETVEGLTATVETLRAKPSAAPRRTGMKKPAGPGEAKRADVAATVQR